jgi:hypothetical protein
VLSSPERPSLAEMRAVLAVEGVFHDVSRASGRSILTMWGLRGSDAYQSLLHDKGWTVS